MKVKSRCCRVEFNLPVRGNDIRLLSPPQKRLWETGVCDPCRKKENEELDNVIDEVFRDEINPVHFRSSIKS